MRQLYTANLLMFLYRSLLKCCFFCLLIATVFLFPAGGIWIHKDFIVMVFTATMAICIGIGRGAVGSHFAAHSWKLKHANFGN